MTPDGEKGQLHVVIGGDTLWDITHHYIETPWIWPSIWRENANVLNPHLIYPGKLIGKTRTSRKVYLTGVCGKTLAIAARSISRISITTASGAN